MNIAQMMGRCVAEALYGIAAGDSVHLSEIARTLGEEISLKKIIYHLRARLAHPGLRSHLTEALIRDVSGRIREDSFLIIDVSEIVKRYASKMEYLVGYEIAVRGQ